VQTAFFANYTASNSQGVSDMTIPQAALYIIGRKKIADFRPLNESFQNSVWHVSTKDGQGFFVKKSANKWAWQNEIRAYHFLMDQGIPGPGIYAAYGDTLVFFDDGVRPPVLPQEATFRGAGRMLRRIHDSHPLPEEAMSSREDTLVNTAFQRAVASGYRPQTPAVPTHGDVQPANMAALPDGCFAYFLDFEEFWGGDPAIDLMIAIVECCRSEPNRMADVASWLLEGYFAWDKSEPRLALWREPEQRRILAEAAYDSLIDWAKLCRLPEEESDLNTRRTAVLSCIETDRTLTVN